MILITGPLYSGKRTFARALPGRCIADVQQLGGITGDLAGWFLQKTELWMLAALCACQWGGLL